jgi:hypothetical protein
VTGILCFSGNLHYEFQKVLPGLASAYAPSPYGRDGQGTSHRGLEEHATYRLKVLDGQMASGTPDAASGAYFLLEKQ